MGRGIIPGDSFPSTTLGILSALSTVDICKVQNKAVFATTWIISACTGLLWHLLLPNVPQRNQMLQTSVHRIKFPPVPLSQTRRLLKCTK